MYRDYFNDSYMVDVKVNDELANRLGITDASVSQTLAGAFDGAAVSTFWEGDRAVSHQAAARPGLPLILRGYREYLSKLGTDPCQGPAPGDCHAGAGMADQQDRPQKRRAHLDDPGLPEAGALRFENPGAGNAEDQSPGAAGRLPDRLWRRER